LLACGDRRESKELRFCSSMEALMEAIVEALVDAIMDAIMDAMTPTWAARSILVLAGVS
jgi:hypothetical protein